MNNDISIAFHFHESTKHSYLSVRTDRYYLDWSNFPYFFKIYEDVQSVELPKEFPKPREKALDAASSKSKVNKDNINLNTIAELLYFTAGISRITNFGNEKYYFRVAPATGALYSTELYLFNCDLQDLEAGVYHFDPYNFRLNVLRKGDYRKILSEISNEQDISQAPISIVLTSLGWRNVWKYRKRSYRHWFWDSGAMTANLLAVANAEGLEYKIVTGFVDEQLNKLLGLDGKKECALSIIAIGPREYVSQNYATDFKEINHRVKPLSKKEVEYEEIYNLHYNSSLKDIKELKEWKSNAAKPLKYEHSQLKDFANLRFSDDDSDELWKVILRRGSTRRFSREPISLLALSKILEKAMSPLNADFLGDSANSLIDIFLIANDVEDLESGAYHYDKERRVVEVLKKGKFRNLASYLCLEQELAGDASVVFFLMTDLKKVLEKYGNRGYRLCNYEAGIRAGMIYLAAYSLNLGATGLTFYDDDVIDFFSPHAKDRQNMLVVAVGIPAYKAKMGKIYTDLGL
ncbi:MAG TPA: SagB/ThcOx family dehydrogenase [Geobacterales bacterium]|nr:SagB/ThcOx family dehydrogenase [Geobacterales bacterium]